MIIEAASTTSILKENTYFSAKKDLAVNYTDKPV